MNEFKLETLYQDYLNKVKLDESQMSPIQKIETKRAFMAGCAQILTLMTEKISNLPVDEALEILKDLYHQLDVFWKEEVNREFKEVVREFKEVVREFKNK